MTSARSIPRVRGGVKLVKPVMIYQVQINGQLVKKQFKVTNVNSLWTQFNNYAKGKGAKTYEYTGAVLGGIIWILPNEDKMTVVKLLPNGEVNTAPPAKEKYYLV